MLSIAITLSSGPQKTCAADGKLTHGSAAPDCNHVTSLDIAVFRGHVTRGKDVRKEKCLFVAHAIGHFHGSGVGERHADVLGLPAGVTAEQMGIPEKSLGMELDP